MKHKTSFIVVTILLWQIFCIKDFENLELCSAYKTFPTEEGNYGDKGVPSTENYPSARYIMPATYSKKKNTLWIFGGHTIFTAPSGLKKSYF